MLVRKRKDAMRLRQKKKSTLSRISGHGRISAGLCKQHISQNAERSSGRNGKSRSSAVLGCLSFNIGQISGGGPTVSDGEKEPQRYFCNPPLDALCNTASLAGSKPFPHLKVEKNWSC